MRSLHKGRKPANAMYDFASNGAVLKYMCGGKYMNQGGRANGDPIPEKGTYAYAKMRAMEQTGSDLDDLIKFVRANPEHQEAPTVQKFINTMYSGEAIPEDLPPSMGYNRTGNTLWYNNPPETGSEEMDQYDEPVSYEDGGEIGDEPSASDYRGRQARLRRRELRKAMREGRKEARDVARARAGRDLMGTAGAQIGSTEAGAELERELRGRGIGLQDYYRPGQRARRERQLLNMAQELGLPAESFGMTGKGFSFSDRLPGGAEAIGGLFSGDMSDQERMDLMDRVDAFQKAYSDYVDPTTNVNALREFNLPELERGEREPREREPRGGRGSNFRINKRYTGNRSRRGGGWKPSKPPMGKRIGDALYRAFGKKPKACPAYSNPYN